jgi:hypothetical protein
VLVVVLVLENPDRFAIRLTEQISSIGLFAVKPNARGRGRGRRRGRGTIPTSEFRLKKRSTSEQTEAPWTPLTTCQSWSQSSLGLQLRRCCKD